MRVPKKNMNMPIISYMVEKNEDGSYESIIRYNKIVEKIISKKIDIKDKLNNFINNKILVFLPEELASIHYEKGLPTFQIIIGEQGILCNSFYLGFLQEEDKNELKKIIEELMIILAKEYKI